MSDPNDERRQRAEERLHKAGSLETTPAELAQVLRLYCVGQDDVIDTLSVSIYQHLLRCRRASSGLPILQHLHVPPTLLIGPTGCGKSTLMRAIARVTSLPIYIADATRLTEEGYVGESASDWIRGLLMAAEGHVPLAEHGILVIDEIDKRRSAPGRPGGPAYRDVSGSGAQEGLLHILSGGTVMVDVTSRNEDGPSRRAVPVRTSHILIVAAGAFEGLEEIVGQRMMGKRRMGFGQRVEEHSPSSEIDLSRTGVTPDDIIEYGLHRQLVGRLEKCMVMQPLSRDTLRRILCEAHDGPIKTQEMLAREAGFNFEWSEPLIEEIVSQASASGLGARALWGLAHTATLRAWYEVPHRLRQVRSLIPGQAIVQLRRDSLDGYYGLHILDAAEAIANIRNPQHRESGGESQASAEAG